MISDSQRKRLFCMAQNIKPAFQIGKHVGAGEIIDISIALDTHELVRLSVSDDATVDVKTVMNAVCALTGAEPVGIIDGDAVIFRRSAISDIEHIDVNTTK